MHHPLHDYREACIYHVTVVCSGRAQILGRIAGTCASDARCVLSPLGFDISREIQAIPAHCATKGRHVQILAKVVMPEHVHFVLYVKERLDIKMQLIMRGFKQGCNKALRKWLEAAREQEARQGAGQDAGQEAGQGAGQGAGQEAGLEKPAMPNSREESCHDAFPNEMLLGNAAFLRQLSALARHNERIGTLHALFEEDFDETRLRRRGQLDTMIRYVHNNPSHRWQKMHHRDLLVPMRHIPIAGHDFDAIGNVNLLALPRQQVHVRSRWTPQERRDYMNRCILQARHGYALVSPFISEWEKAVQDVALKEGHSVVILCDNGFSDFAQCPGNLYEYCLQGQVLLLADSGRPRIERKARISRQECVALNDMTLAICEEK